MRHLILLLIASLACAGDAKPKPLPLETQAEIARSEKAIAGLKADYLKKANEEIIRLTDALQDQKKKMTQAGDLEGALILRDKIAEVGNGDMIIVTNQNVDLFGKPAIPQAIMGKWQRSDGIMVWFKPDKSVEMIHKGKVIDKGRWSVLDVRIIMQWEHRGQKIWVYDAQTDTVKNDTQTILNRVKS